MEKHSINQRIIDVIEFLDTTPTVFADQIGIQRSGLSHILKGRNRPSLDVIQKIVARYPDISLNWLVNGTGNISSTTPSVINLQQKKQPSSSPIATEPAKSSEKSLKNTLFDPSGNDETSDLQNGSSSTVSSASSGSSREETGTIRRTFTPQDFELPENTSPQTTAAMYSPTPNPVPRGAENRKIAKILVFYTDNTFEEFLR